MVDLVKPARRERVIRIAHSPDADDAFMFHALAEGRVRVDGLRFEHILCDIETLNQAALEGRYEVSAISIHAYPEVADRYALMSCGASMGEGYGPVVVARRPTSKLALRGARIAIPGFRTSAYLAARLWLGAFEAVAVPFDQIGDAVLRGDVDAGVLIHEGQLTYGAEGFHLVRDLGVWWREKTGLPLPLGGNIVRRDLGPELARAVTAAVHDSIAYALEHRKEALGGALRHARGLAEGDADRFVGMYVNPRTLDYGPDGREAVRMFLRMGHEQGYLPHVPPEIEFVDATLEPVP